MESDYKGITMKASKSKSKSKSKNTSLQVSRSSSQCSNIKNIQNIQKDKEFNNPQYSQDDHIIKYIKLLKFGTPKFGTLNNVLKMESEKNQIKKTKRISSNQQTQLLIRKIKNKLNPINVFQIYAERAKKNNHQIPNNNNIPIQFPNMKEFKLPEISKFKYSSQFSPNLLSSKHSIVFLPLKIRNKVQNFYSNELQPITHSNENNFTISIQNNKTESLNNNHLANIYNIYNNNSGNIFSREISPRFHDIQQNLEKSVNYPVTTNLNLNIYKIYKKMQKEPKFKSLHCSENYCSSLNYINKNININSNSNSNRTNNSNHNKNERNLKNRDITGNIYKNTIKNGNENENKHIIDKSFLDLNDKDNNKDKDKPKDKINIRSNYTNLVRYNNSLLINNELKLALRKNKLNFGLSNKIRDILQYSETTKSNSINSRKINMKQTNFEDHDEFDDLRYNEIVSHWKNIAGGKQT